MKKKVLNQKIAIKYTKKVPGWILDKKCQKISKEFNFKNFLQAMKFIKKVAQIAESENHHPDIHIFYNKILLELSTHPVGGLSKEDFIVASQIDAIS